MKIAWKKDSLKPCECGAEPLISPAMGWVYRQCFDCLYGKPVRPRRDRDREDKAPKLISVRNGWSVPAGSILESDQIDAIDDGEAVTFSFMAREPEHYILVREPAA